MIVSNPGLVEGHPFNVQRVIEFVNTGLNFGDAFESVDEVAIEADKEVKSNSKANPDDRPPEGLLQGKHMAFFTEEAQVKEKQQQDYQDESSKKEDFVGHNWSGEIVGVKIIGIFE